MASGVESGGPGGALLGLTQVLHGVLLGHWLFGEPLTARFLWGGALVLAGAGWLTWNETRGTLDLERRRKVQPMPAEMSPLPVSGRVAPPRHRSEGRSHGRG